MRGRIRKRGLRYEATYWLKGSDGKRRWRSQSFGTRREASAWLAGEIDRINKGLVAAPGRLTVEDLFGHWLLHLEETLDNASTLAGYRKCAHNYILPALGAVRLRELSPGHFEDMYRTLLKPGARKRGSGGLSRRTVQYVHVTAHRACEWAARLASSQPCRPGG